MILFVSGVVRIKRAGYYYRVVRDDPFGSDLAKGEIVIALKNIHGSFPGVRRIDVNGEARGLNWWVKWNALEGPIRKRKAIKLHRAWEVKHEEP